jgi:hypothetical protein
MVQPRQGVVRAPAELSNYLSQQEDEYGEWVAAQDIFAGLALAYREGDPVPKSNVALHGYDKNGMVRKATPDPEPKKAKEEK